jgi:hypothetical protein
MKKLQRLMVSIKLLVLLIGCTPKNIAEVDNNSGKVAIQAIETPLATIQPRPSFVRDIAPPESTSIPLKIYQYVHPEIMTTGLMPLEDAWEYGYQSQICADIDLGELVQPADDFGAVTETGERFQLIVDDVETRTEPSIFGGAVEVTNTSMNPMATWEHFSIFCWLVPLDSGIHEIVLQFQQTSGSIQEYTWQFALTGATFP